MLSIKSFVLYCIVLFKYVDTMSEIYNFNDILTFLKSKLQNSLYGIALMISFETHGKNKYRY